MIFVKRRWPAAVAALAASIAAGCGNSLRDEGERAVRAYCKALIIAYQTSDAGVVRPVATDKEWTKIHSLIDIKRAGGWVLESELESLEVTDVEQPSPEEGEGEETEDGGGIL